MSSPPDYGKLLQQWLPAVWRERDNTRRDIAGNVTGPGDLACLLGVYGELLDAFHATLEQRLYDSFPDPDAKGRHCQAWLLPYFAQLLDVSLHAPDEAGRRVELARAVAWRQRKGTRVTLEEIAEAVGRLEVEIQEGWKRVAIAPRVDRPLLPEAAYGEEAIPAAAGAAARANHPGLPAATVDLRRCSRAVRCEADNPAAHQTNFAGERLYWRQVNRHGLPCASHSFQDVSRRTVDLRTPDSRRGHVHPRRVLLYLPPPEGLCSARAPVLNWSELPTSGDFDGEHVRIRRSTTAWRGETLPLVSYTGLGEVPVKLRGVHTLTTRAVYRFENLWLDNKLQLDDGALQLVGCAAREVKVVTAERAAPVIEAHACLIKRVEAARGRVLLEYCTVLDTLLAERLDASDSILLPPLRKDTVDNDVPAAGCIRFSRLFHLPEPPDPEDPTLPNDPLWISQTRRSALRCYANTCTTLQPWFWRDGFGHPGCGVLHPGAKPIFLSGAEDGGELGACHDLRYALRRQAVLDKLAEFQPVGMEVVLVMDHTLACAPPREIHP